MTRLLDHIPDHAYLNAQALRAAFDVQKNNHTQYPLQVNYEFHTFRLLDGGPVYYDRGIKPFFIAMAAQAQTSPKIENHILVSVADKYAEVAYGAGHQLVVQYPVISSLSALQDNMLQQQQQLKDICAQQGIGFVAIGYHPDRDAKKFHIVSKQLYHLMQQRYQYLQGQGVSVMTNAAEVSVRLFPQSMQEFIEIWQAALLIAPYLQAAFGNSPMELGQLGHAQSIRTLRWLQVDQARTNCIKSILKKDFKIDDYIEWALGVPMFGVLREGRGIDVQFASFAQCLKNPRQYLELQDWTTHLSTLYPPVRFHQGIEIRCCDTGSRAHVLALCALLKGLLYDPAQRKTILKQFWPRDLSSFMRLFQKVGKDGLWAMCPLFEQPVWRTLQLLYKQAQQGLKNIHCHRELVYLAPFNQAIETRMSPADEITERYGRDFKSIHQLFLGLRPD